MFGVVWTLAAELVPHGFVRIFITPTDSILSIAPGIIRRYGISFLLLPFSIFSTYYFQAMMKPSTAFVVSVSRGALEAGISKSLVTKWKTNNTEIPSPDVISKLSKYFGLPVSELLGEEPKKAPTEDGERSENGDILDEVDVAFYGDYKQLTEENKETLRAMARLFRERQGKQE